MSFYGEKKKRINRPPASLAFGFGAEAWQATGHEKFRMVLYLMSFIKGLMCLRLCSYQ
jgi:hypothetical protein